MQFGLHPAIVSLLAVLTSPLLAQAPQVPSPSPTPIGEEIVVTASTLPESIESTPSSVTVITRAQIEKREARDVADVLRDVPGLVVARSGTPGKVASLFTRGGNSTQTLVLWNGIELNNPYFSGYDWGRFSTAGVQQIEVARGPFSALYGSEAMTGVVNVLTGGRTYGALDLEGGQNGFFNGAASGAFSGDHFATNAALERRNDDGFAANDDFSQTTALGGFTWKQSPEFTVGLEGRYTSYDLGIPFIANGAGSAIVASPFRRQNGNELQLALPLHLRRTGIDYDVTVSRAARDDEFSDPDDPYFLTESSTQSTTDRARAAMTLRTAAGSITVGGEYENARVRDVSSYGTNLDDNRRTSRSLFAEDRGAVRLSAGSTIEISAGLRWDDFDTFGSQLSPRVAAAWVSGSEKIRAAWGRSFRAPSVGELYYPFFGNENLQPEKGSSAEVGYDHFFSQNGLFSVSAFDNHFTDLITFNPQTGTTANIGAATSRGLEVSVQGPIRGPFSAALSYTLLRTREEATDSPLLRRPRNSGSLAFNYGDDPWSAVLSLQHNGRRTDFAALAPFGTVVNSPYTVGDLTIQYHTGILRPYLRVENVGDARYEEVVGFPAARRRASAGVRISLR
ncbi:MAG: TonB-dependent receptor [Acidobacteriota bacterium]